MNIRIYPIKNSIPNVPTHYDVIVEDEADAIIYTTLTAQQGLQLASELQRVFSPLTEDL